MELNCPVKDYHWGKKGSSSLVAQLKSYADPDFKIDESKTYAELWMGTHSSGPALLKESEMLLSSWLGNNLSAIGKECIHTFGNELPYLFKVLSIEMPLSIQVHPSKTEAERLHANDPYHYKDNNHKPELAIALTNFEGLCGFRPYDEIKIFFSLIPELRVIIGEKSVEDFIQSNGNDQENLKKCFVSLMNAKESEVKIQLDLLVNRLSKADSVTKENSLESLLNKIHRYFPGDIGCFCIYFLNYLILKPGEAIFLGAGEPHAYISGDCIECMACSDNVVRAGLTPKYRDVETLCKILDYSSKNAASKLLFPEKENDCSSIFRPPSKEFAVCKLKVPANSKYNIKPRKSASICLIVEGCGILNSNITLSKGKVFFVGSEELCSIHVTDSTNSLLLFQAFVNIC